MKKVEFRGELRHMRDYEVRKKRNPSVIQ